MKRVTRSSKKPKDNNDVISNTYIGFPMHIWSNYTTVLLHHILIFIDFINWHRTCRLAWNTILFSKKGSYKYLVKFRHRCVENNELLGFNIFHGIFYDNLMELDIIRVVFDMIDLTISKWDRVIYDEEISYRYPLPFEPFYIDELLSLARHKETDDKYLREITIRILKMYTKYMKNKLGWTVVIVNEKCYSFADISKTRLYDIVCLPPNDTIVTLITDGIYSIIDKINIKT